MCVGSKGLDVDTQQDGSCFTNIGLDQSHITENVGMLHTVLIHFCLHCYILSG